MTFRTSIIALAAGALLAASFCADAQERKRYRWVDEDGVVHYGDRIPPEYAQQAVDEISDQGIRKSAREAPKTEEELVELEQERALEAKAARAAEAQARRDRMLINSYVSVGDIEEARERRITALESQVRLSRSAIERLESQLAELRKTADQHEAAGRELPEELAENMSSIDSQLEATRTFVEAREREIEEYESQFAADIERFRELRGGGSR